MKEMLVPEFVAGFEDPQTRRLKGIVSLLDDYRWGALLDVINEKFAERFDINEVLTEDDFKNDAKLASIARNHVIFRVIMKELRELPRELKQKLKEVE